MRFNSLDELVKYMFDNELSISDIEMDVERETGEDPTVTPDVIEEPPAEPEVEPQGQKLQESIILHLASGTINVPIDGDGFMVVEDFAMTPNACGTGYIVIDSRKIHLNMCEMEGKTVAYLHTSNNTKEAVSVRRKN